MRYKHDCLQIIILKHLLFNNKIHLILLFFIILSAWSVIFITHETRISIQEREKYYNLKEKENNQWFALILKKYELIDSLKVE